MIHNLGAWDRAVRLAIASLMLWLLVAGKATGLWAPLVAAIAVGMILTAMIGVCPLYQRWGISTCRLARRG